MYSRTIGTSMEQYYGRQQKYNRAIGSLHNVFSEFRGISGDIQAIFSAVERQDGRLDRILQTRCDSIAESSARLYRFCREGGFRELPPDVSESGNERIPPSVYEAPDNDSRERTSNRARARLLFRWASRMFSDREGQ